MLTAYGRHPWRLFIRHILRFNYVYILSHHHTKVFGALFRRLHPSFHLRNSRRSVMVLSLLRYSTSASVQTLTPIWTMRSIATRL